MCEWWRQIKLVQQSCFGWNKAFALPVCFSHNFGYDHANGFFLSCNRLHFCHINQPTFDKTVTIIKSKELFFFLFFFCMSNLSIGSICYWYSKWDFVPSFSSSFVFNIKVGSRFYTAVKYQTILWTSVLFLMILHIFSCCSSVFEVLDIGKRKKKKKGFCVRFVLYANRKMKNRQKITWWLNIYCSEMLVLFVIFKDMRLLLVPIPYCASCPIVV